MLLRRAPLGPDNRRDGNARGHCLRVSPSSSGYGSRTRCLRLMRPLWKPFHSPARRSIHAGDGMSRAYLQFCGSTAWTFSGFTTPLGI